MNSNLHHALSTALSPFAILVPVLVLALPVPAAAANSTATAGGGVTAPDPAYGQGTVSAIVEKALLRDAVVPLNEVEVAATPAGDVVLRGQVSTLLGVERAAKIALAPRGVRSVTNLIQLAPGKTVDAKVLEGRIRTVLRADPAVQDQQVDVAVTKGGSTRLTGAVGSLAEQTLIDRLVKNIAGVTALQNDLRIETSPYRRPPEQLQTVVKELLQLDAFMDSSQMRVEVNADNTVSLSGRVASDADRRRAIAIAWTTGTTRVRSEELMVDPALL